MDKSFKLQVVPNAYVWYLSELWLNGLFDGKAHRSGGRDKMPELPIDKLFVLLFMMTGPLRVVPGFSAIAGNLDPDLQKRLALRSTLYASLGVLLAIFVGHTVLRSWGATPEALATASGLLLLLTALQSLVGGASSSSQSISGEDLLDRLALSPIAFPTILPPFAVGVLILFGANFPTFESQLKMSFLAIGILVVDYFSMCFANRIMATIGSSTLQVLGAVFGVLQLALAVQMIFWALKSVFVVG